MKNVFENYQFVLSFIAIDILFYVMFYVLHAFIFGGFIFSEALLKGGYELYWRVISLQVVLQILFMFAGLKIGFQRELMILLAALLAFAIASFISFSDISSLWKLMKLPTKDVLGEGFAISMSVIITMVIFRIFQRQGA